MASWQKPAAMALGGVAVLLLMAQLVRPDETNPTFDPAKTVEAQIPMPAETAELLYGACGDCHSDKTVWPFYAKITPINWWIAGHVDEGRHHLNLSEWTYDDTKTRKKLKHIIDELEEPGMPPAYYKPLHPKSQLTDAQSKTLIDWAQAALDARGGALPEPKEEE